MAEDKPPLAPTGNSPPRKTCITRRHASDSSFVDEVIDDEDYSEEEEETMRTNSSSLDQLTPLYSLKSIDEEFEEEEGDKLLISPFVTSQTEEISPPHTSFESLGEMDELPQRPNLNDKNISFMFKFVIVFNFIFLSL